MNKNYQKSWFSLAEYLEVRGWNKYKANKVPAAFNNYFSTADEMWEMLTVRIQEMINLYFNGYFDFIPFEFLKSDYQFWIKMAIFDTFEAIMNGRMPFYSNVELVFTNNNQNYSLTNDFKNDNNNYADIFPPQAIKWLNMTNLRSAYKFKSWREAFDYWVSQVETNHLITLEDIEKLFEALDLTNINVLKEVQETLKDYEIDNNTWKKETLADIDARISVTEIAREIIADEDAMNQIGKVAATTIAESEELVQPLTDVATIVADTKATIRLDDFVNTAASNKDLVNNVASAINGDIAGIPQMKKDIEAAETKIDHDGDIKGINGTLNQKVSFVVGETSYQNVASSSVIFTLTGAQFTNLTMNDFVIFNIYGIEKSQTLQGRFNKTISFWGGTSDAMYNHLFTAPSIASTSLERTGYIIIQKTAVNVIRVTLTMLNWESMDTIRMSYTILKGVVQ
ncbi:hypothetical protein LD119_00714 [Mesoplasma sp. JKS002660]|uniref:hypothetical protein n=1 Tax=Mesoplasma whartonense TaxID=2878854 RepID=UPI002022A9EA|nr:hypothetical protein [Mesoplasma sp. JKS002660]MCL8213763.1 hypothetical protein [Mesoplasma sp. JKS002660]